MMFTPEEINFICIALGKSKDDTVNNIWDMMPDIYDEDMKKIGETVLEKLGGISEDEFSETDFQSQFAE